VRSETHTSSPIFGDYALDVPNHESQRMTRQADNEVMREVDGVGNLAPILCGRYGRQQIDILALTNDQIGANSENEISRPVATESLLGARADDDSALAAGAGGLK
jgi:hypothetical protein